MAKGWKCLICHQVHPVIFDARPFACPFCKGEEMIVPIEPDANDKLDEAFLWMLRRKQDIKRGIPFKKKKK